MIKSYEFHSWHYSPASFCHTNLYKSCSPGSWTVEGLNVVLPKKLWGRGFPRLCTGRRQFQWPRGSSTSLHSGGTIEAFVVSHCFIATPFCFRTWKLELIPLQILGHLYFLYPRTLCLNSEISRDRGDLHDFGCRFEWSVRMMRTTSSFRRPCHMYSTPSMSHVRERSLFSDWKEVDQDESTLINMTNHGTLDENVLRCLRDSQFIFMEDSEIYVRQENSFCSIVQHHCGWRARVKKDFKLVLWLVHSRAPCMSRFHSIPIHTVFELFDSNEVCGLKNRWLLHDTMI